MNTILALIASIFPKFFGKYVAFTEYNTRVEKKEWDSIKEMLKED